MIAFHFGTEEAVGVYFYCLTAVFTVGLFLGMVNASVLIPESMRISESQGELHSQAFLNVFLLGYAFLGISIALLLQVYPVDLFLFLSRFDRTFLENHTGVVMITTLLLPLVMISAFLVEVLNSRQFFTVAMLANLTSGFCVLVFILLFQKSIGVQSIALGMLIGYLVQVGGALLLMRLLLHWSFRLSWKYHKLQVWKDLLFAQLGNLSTVFVNYLPFFLLSDFSPVLIAALSYGISLAAMPNALLTDQVSSVAAIKLNKLLLNDQKSDVDKIYKRTCHFLLFLLVPGCLFLSLNADQIVTLVYGRGAFNAESIRDATEFFRLLILLPPFIAVNSINSRLFMGARLVRQGVWYQLFINGLMAVSIVVAVQLLGPYGYPIGLLITYLLNLCSGYVLLKRYFPGVDYVVVASYFVKMLFVGGLLSSLVIAAAAAIPFGNETLILLSQFVAYGCCLFVLNHWLHLNDDFRETLQGFLERFKSKFA